MRSFNLLHVRSVAVLLVGLAWATLMFGPTPTMAANFTGWDFEDGTLQGWTMASSSTIGPKTYAATGKTDEPPLPETFWDPLGFNSKSPVYGFAAAPSPFIDRALAQDAPLVLRSPKFALSGGGQIIAHVLGGIPGEVSVPPTNFSALSGASISTTGSDASYQGLALRRDSDGEYLLHKKRTSNSSSYTGWQQLTFTEAELDGVIAANPGEMFTLDLIDTAHGTFSSLNLDTISIPQPTGASIIQGGEMWSIHERLATSSVIGLAGADALMALPMGDPGIADKIDYTASTINIHDGGPMSGHFGNDAGPLFVLGRDNFVASISGNINVLQSGPVTFGFYSNAGARLRIDGNLVAQDNYGDLSCDTLGTINLLAGVHHVDFLYWEDTGMETVELYVATTLGQFTSTNQAAFELLQPTNLPLPSGDYNNDGKFNAADYVLWRKDPNAFGGPAGYSAWRAHFGDPPGSGSGIDGTGAVPEPASGCLLVGAMIAGLIAFRRSR